MQNIISYNSCSKQAGRIKKYWKYIIAHRPMFFVQYKQHMRTAELKTVHKLHHLEISCGFVIYSAAAAARNLYVSDRGGGHPIARIV